MPEDLAINWLIFQKLAGFVRDIAECRWISPDSQASCRLVSRPTTRAVLGSNTLKFCSNSASLLEEFAG